MLVFADGSQTGTLGGGCVEAEVKRRALAALAKRKAEMATLQLDHDYAGMTADLRRADASSD